VKVLNFLEEKNSKHRKQMKKFNSIIFGIIKVPEVTDSYESVQFTALDFSEIRERFEVRMYPEDRYSPNSVENPTQTKSLELVGWEVV
jgi:hypothetical protein